MKKVSIGALRWDVGWSVAVQHQNCTNTFGIVTVDIGEAWMVRKEGLLLLFCGVSCWWRCVAST